MAAVAWVASASVERRAFPLNDYHRLGQVFTASEPFNILWVSAPSWNDNEGGFTLSLWDSPARRRLWGRKAFRDIPDNARVTLYLLPARPPGRYYWEIHDRTGETRIGLYGEVLPAETEECAYFDGEPNQRVRFVFGLRHSPYVGSGRRHSWTYRQRLARGEPETVPHWIWFPEPLVAAQVKRWFRRTFDLPTAPQQARLLVTGDDAYTLFLNGQEVSRGGQPVIREHEVTDLLRVGRNVLAAEVFNAIAPAGLLVELRLTLPTGEPLVLRSDISWKSSDRRVEGWEGLDFDDSDWKPAVDVGDVYAGPWYGTGNIAEYFPLPVPRELLARLRSEPPARAEVRSRRGAPRLFVNGQEVFPLFVWSNDLLEFAPDFAAFGLHQFHPFYNLAQGWRGPNEYDWSGFEALLTRLVHLDPKARFLVRLGLFAPGWWVEAHPAELIRCADGTGLINDRFGGTKRISLASEVWRRDTTAALRSFLRFVEHSPLRSRVLGYQIANGIYGEWHYFGARYVPDVSEPMRRACGGYTPTLEERLRTAFGLFRDPAQERAVIEYYRRFHALGAETLLHFARVVKEETSRRVLCGAFYAYLLENLWIQEGGHLAPLKVLNSPDIDFLACPYSYQGDAYDAAGNWLGRGRGVGGDGGYRVLVESAKRHGKLYFAEMDPSTGLEFQPERMGFGGPGGDTMEGSRRILQRDLAQLMAQGTAGWLFDIGPGWYADETFLRDFRRFNELGQRRAQWDLSSVAEVAAVYDVESFFATAHWKAVPGEGEYDLFGHWFLRCQSRSLHRLGAPVDFLYHDDLTPEVARQYRLILVVNCFALTEAEKEALQAATSGSGATVVWFYAPGLVAPEGLAPQRVAELTGLRLELVREPGEMLIKAEDDRQGKLAPLPPFGLPGKHWPRFVVIDPEAKVWGVWADNGQPALAVKEENGWTSVYVGTAPLPVEWLRFLARSAGVHLYSDRPDVVYAARDCVALIASEEGERTVHLPRPLILWNADGPPQREYHLTLERGEVRLFVPEKF